MLKGVPFLNKGMATASQVDPTHGHCQASVPRAVGGVSQLTARVLEAAAGRPSHSHLGHLLISIMSFT